MLINVESLATVWEMLEAWREANPEGNAEADAKWQTACEVMAATREAAGIPSEVYCELFDALVAEFAAWKAANAMPEGDATDLLACADLTPDQRAWLSDFVARWDEMEETR